VKLCVRETVRKGNCVESEKNKFEILMRVFPSPGNWVCKLEVACEVKVA